MLTWWRKTMDTMYAWAVKAANSRHALWILGAVAAVESSVFPIPPDVFLIPIVLVNRRRAVAATVVCLTGSVLGAYCGYVIGWQLYDLVAVPLLDFYGYQEQFARFQDMYNEYGAWIIAGAGFTPFPYKVITIASGMMGTNLVTFTIASVISRGARFAIVAFVIWKYGDSMRGWLERNLGWLSILFFVLLLGSFYLLQYL
jgi:membrane protein YqaA with SNARE-associated domain